MHPTRFPAAIALFIFLAAPAPLNAQSLPLPEAPKPEEGIWVPGSQINISQGCLKKWVCDCSKVKAPRRARLGRTPSESTAGVCKAGPGGACAVCGAKPPEKKCMCEVKHP